MPQKSQIISIIHPTGEKEAVFSESIVAAGDKVLVLTNKDELDDVEAAFSQ